MPIRSARPRAVLLLTAVAALGMPPAVGHAASRVETAPYDTALRPGAAHRSEARETASPEADGRGRDGGSWSAAPSAGAGTAPGSGGEEDGAREQFYLEGGPGTVLEDTVSITNESRKARTYTLRGADARNGADGGFAVRKKSQDRATGRWIGTADEEVRVPARTRADIPVTVTVPADTVPGDHPGALVVSGGGREVAVPVQLRVTGPAVPALSVEDVAVGSAEDGSAEVEYVVVNRGNTALSPRVALRSEGLLGPGSESGPRDLDVEVPPGERVTLREPWPAAPDLDSADVTVRVTADGAEDEGTATYTALPWPVPLGLLALLVAGGGGGRYMLRRRRPHTPPDIDSGPEGDSAPSAQDGQGRGETDGQAEQTDGQSELTATGAAK